MLSKYIDYYTKRIVYSLWYHHTHFPTTLRSRKKKIKKLITVHLRHLLVIHEIKNLLNKFFCVYYHYTSSEDKIDTFKRKTINAHNVKFTTEHYFFLTFHKY